MTNTPEVNWAEGMFLRPQHLQLSSRHISSLIGAVVRGIQPLFWGFSRLEVDVEQLEAFTFALHSCEVVFKDATRGRTPASLEIEPREFKSQLDSSDGRLTVYLGVARLREGERNSTSQGDDEGPSDIRYAIRTLDVFDENLGGEPRALEVRKLRGRFFLGDENREGYECLPVSVIQRAGAGSNAPSLDEEFVPPVIDIAAWEPLRKSCESVLHRIEAKHRFLRAEVAEGRIDLDVAGADVWQPVFKLQIVGAFLQVLRQLVKTPGLHPFQLYLEFARLAGELSIFEPEDADSVKIPLYDHDAVGACFNTAVYTIDQLLETILSGGFVKVAFELEEDLLVARLKEEWFDPSAEIYLCVQSDLGDRSIMSRLETAKIGASEDIPLLKQRRLFGLDIDLLNRTPGGLPSRGDLHYFSIGRDGMYWESVTNNREMAISGIIDPQIQFSLFVILKPVRNGE
jgi:type VI secretion system protein ImpJ